MFRSNQLGTPNGIPSVGHAEQYRNGGGPAFINNVFQGTTAAMLGAQDSHGKFTPGNARLGATFPGPAGAEVPAGSTQFKLQFLVYVPTADLFARMRAAQAAQQLQRRFMNGEGDDNGLERFITATRRQNFLIPPRRHRAFPLVELASLGPPGSAPTGAASGRRGRPRAAGRPGNGGRSADLAVG